MSEDSVRDPQDPRVMSGQIWEDLCDTLRDAGGFVTGPEIPDSPLERAAGFRYLTQFLEAGINFCVAHADPDCPEFTRMMDLGMRWGLDSPDCLYLVATICGEGTYRVWGDPGTANYLDVQLNQGHYADGSIESVNTIASISGDELERSSDGSLEFFFGGEPRQSNWLPLADGARFVMIRQNFYDWENERPANLQIERVDAPVARANLRTDQIAERIDVLRSWMSKGQLLWENMSKGMLGLAPNSTFTFMPKDASEHSGMAGQIYCQGNFRCAPDEAVIFTFEPPLSRHWNISIASVYWEAVDFVTRHGSLNGHQATLDEDGRFRVVIAHEDPGVPNWLDTCGHEKGTIIARFILAEADLPDPTSCVVALAEVRDALPANTGVVTAEQRAATIGRRRDSLWKRYRR